MLAQIYSLTKKDIYSGHTEYPKESPIVHNCSNQEDVATKTAHTINVQTSVVEKTPV